MQNHSICPPWLAFGLINEIRKIIHNPQDLFKDFIKPGNVVADIGCGPGYFSIPMSYMVGSKGRVISVDIQNRMIDKLQKRVKRLNLEYRFTTIVNQGNDLGIKDKVDFVLTFWMVHEVKNLDSFFIQINNMLKDDGRYLLVEPKIHVTKSEYSETLKRAELNGLKMQRDIKIRFSRASLFYK
jgi:ubiquinone/menaquinone biosynthesis C-methylase UbiE